MNCSDDAAAQRQGTQLHDSPMMGKQVKSVGMPFAKRSLCVNCYSGMGITNCLRKEWQTSEHVCQKYYEQPTTIEVDGGVL